LRLWNTAPAAARALPGARRLVLLPLAAAALLAGCRADGHPDAGAETPPAAAANPDQADGAGDSGPDAAPAPAAPMTMEDSIRVARDDSIALAKDYHQRIGSMEGYASCMGKAKVADAQVRPTLEAACKRARGAPQ
jgi:hypothetical protein